MRRLTWRNHSHDQSCHPRCIEHPASTERLVQLVNQAEAENTTIRAVGAGHAWSDVALTDGILVETDQLQGLLDLDDGTLRDAPPADRPLVRVRGGTRVWELNDLLDGRNLGLVNMGGYDAQAIAGVVATSTHGSGIRFGAFPDYVRSMDLVVAGGQLVRVEPSGGITDASAFADRYGDERSLVQDDALFYAAVCAMGCMGIVESLVLEVRDEFWLRESRVVSTWKEARRELEGGVLDREEHYELFLNPYANKQGEHELLVTTRTEVERPETLSPGDGMRHPLIEMQASIPLFWIGLRLAARFAPSLMRTQFGRTLRRMADPNYTQISYKVFNIGAANKLPAYSMELGVPVKDDNHLLTVDRILQVAQECAGRGMYHTSPISLRFVAPSQAYASMMHGEKTMMIELILVSETKKGHPLLEEYERRLAELGSHPHWGQYNTLGADQDVLKRLYPRWDDWVAAYRRFNASGVFNSEFTDRIGISR
jgi:L-gulono-1,4-lactone dehydrogenase